MIPEDSEPSRTVSQRKGKLPPDRSEVGPEGKEWGLGWVGGLGPGVGIKKTRIYESSRRAGSEEEQIQGCFLWGLAARAASTQTLRRTSQDGFDAVFPFTRCVFPGSAAFYGLFGHQFQEIIRSGKTH